MFDIRDFKDLKILFEYLISFNIYKSRYILKLLYIILNKKLFNILYLIELNNIINIIFINSYI